MLVGYMRVSTTDDRQTVDLQRDALVATGVDHRHLHTDKASGARDDRPGLKACLDYLNAGDKLGVLIVGLGAVATTLIARVAGKRMATTVGRRVPLVGGVVGQVVESRDVLFEVVDPARMLVEATTADAKVAARR